MAEPDREAYEAAERLVREAHARAEEAARAGGAGRPAQRLGERARPAAAGLQRAVRAAGDAARARSRPSSPASSPTRCASCLIAIRAILDYSIERLDTSRPPEPQVEDIPIQ